MQRISTRPFVFLCEYHDFNLPEGHVAGLADLASRDGGPLGLVRTHEIVIGTRDAEAEGDRWQRLLDPCSRPRRDAGSPETGPRCA